jgi:2-desacetyl-2-hydroxyethyl bacteriochlorophyllide A dehydrogenase
MDLNQIRMDYLWNVGSRMVALTFLMIVMAILAGLIGSRVAAYIPLFCGECRFCREGRGNICAHRSGLLGWSTDGGYAEYMLLPERNALPLADETSFEEGVLLLDTLGTSGHALRVARYAEAESVLVIGAGPIGIGAVALLQAWGMPRVYVSEFSAYRRQRATEMGAICIDPASQSVEEFMRVAEPDGVDIVFLAVGSVPAIWQSLDLVRPGGTVSIVGEYSGKLELEQCKGSWMLNDLHIIRTFYFTIPEFAENQRLLRQGRISADALITHRFALNDISAAYHTFFSGETLKVMVAP